MTATAVTPMSDRTTPTAPPGWPLGIARIVIGFLWFQQLLWKLPPDFGCGPAGDQGLCDWMQREIANPLIPAYAVFVRDLVLPNLGVLGWLVWLTEAAIAVSLLLGVLTRLGGMLALFCLLFALTGAGRWWGVDVWLLPRLRAAGGPLANVARYL